MAAFVGAAWTSASAPAGAPAVRGGATRYSAGDCRLRERERARARARAVQRCVSVRCSADNGSKESKSSDTRGSAVVGDAKSTANPKSTPVQDMTRVSELKNANLFESTVTLIRESSKSPSDLARTAGVLSFVATVAALVQHSWIVDHKNTALWAVFVVGYAGIILEELLDFNKTGVALLMAVGIWAIMGTAAGGGGSPEGIAQVTEHLNHSISDISEIIYFLIGAMTIVEIVDAHKGFKVITDLIRTNSRRTLLWVVGVVTFFMSAVLDNLTSTIVMVSLLRKLVADPEDRKLYGAVVVIAANAGGAWTPIGDVTTTMLWMNGNLSTASTIRDLFFPSLACLVGALAWLTPGLSGDVERPGFAAEASNEAGALPAADDEDEHSSALTPSRSNLVFAVGLSALVSVPIFKTVTGLPPFLGMISGLGTLWLLTDVMHADDSSKEGLRASAALSRIDVAGTLFFLGILLAVAGLESAGLLNQLAVYLDQHIPSKEIIAVAIGFLSSIVDNVPLVAATLGMYDLNVYPQDSALWQLVAYCAGVGGSILVVGSAAGVALMGMEKVDFFWYLKKVSIPATVGFIGGAGVYFLQNMISTGIVQAPQITASLGM